MIKFNLIAVHLTLLLVTFFAQAKAKDLVYKIAVVTTGPEFKFNQAELTVPFNKTISLTYTNNGDSADIDHGIAILAQDQEKEFLVDLKKNKYDITKVNKKFILSMTKVLSKGDSETIMFKPSATGDYVYTCYMPGHGDMMGMKGIIKVIK